MCLKPIQMMEGILVSHYYYYYYYFSECRSNRMTIQELGVKPMVLDELSEVLGGKSEEIEVWESRVNWWVALTCKTESESCEKEKSSMINFLCCSFCSGKVRDTLRRLYQKWTDSCRDFQEWSSAFWEQKDCGDTKRVEGDQQRNSTTKLVEGDRQRHRVTSWKWQPCEGGGF